MVTKDIQSLFLQDLLISAGDLADSFLFTDRVDQDGRKVNLVWCNKCRQMALGDAELVHAKDCLAGRVSKLIAAIEGPDTMAEIRADGARADALMDEPFLTPRALKEVIDELTSRLDAKDAELAGLREESEKRQALAEAFADREIAALKRAQDADSKLAQLKGMNGIAEQGLQSATGHLNPQPTERHIAYEVEGHDWASEEGNCPFLGRPEVLTHEEAAVAHRGVLA